jgi:hypothetical protein
MWYHEDHEGIINLWGDVTQFAREHGLKYYYFIDSDLNAPINEEERTAISYAHHANPDMTAVYHKGDVTIYKFRE